MAEKKYIRARTIGGVEEWIEPEVLNGSMVYPASGIPVSSGSGWSTSIQNNSANWNTAYDWGNHAEAGYAPVNNPVFGGELGLPANSGSERKGMVRIGIYPSWAGTELNFGISNNDLIGYPAWIQAQTPGNYGLSRPLKLNPNGGDLELGGNTTVKANLNITGETQFHWSSDRYLKKDIRPFNATEILKKIKAYSHRWNKKALKLNPNKEDRKTFGIIAQELEGILPELVHGIYDGKYKSIDYVALIPILIQGFNEQQKEIDNLKTKIKCQE
jgi:hypothetical protein